MADGEYKVPENIVKELFLGYDKQLSDWVRAEKANLKIKHLEDLLEKSNLKIKQLKDLLEKESNLKIKQLEDLLEKERHKFW